MRLLAWLFSLRALDRLAILLIAVLFGSPFGIEALKISGLYLAEIAIALFILYAAAAHGRETWWVGRHLTSPVTIVLLAATLVVGVIGLFVTHDAIAVYGDVRGIFTFIVACNIWIYTPNRPIDKICAAYWIGLLSAILTIVAYQMDFIKAGLLTGDKISYPVFSAAAALLASALVRSGSGMIVATLALGYMAILSFYRVNVILFILFIILAIYLYMLAPRQERRRRSGMLRRMLKIGAFVGGIVCVVWVFYDKVYNYIRSDEMGSRELLGKIENLYGAYADGDRLNISDAQRLSYYADIWDHPGWYVLPKGLGSRAFLEAIGTRFNAVAVMPSTLDSAIYFIVFHYGLVGFVLLAVWCLVSWIRCYKRIGSYPSRVAFIMYALVGVFYLSLTAEVFTIMTKGLMFAIYIYLGRTLMTEDGGERPWAGGGSRARKSTCRVGEGRGTGER